VVIGGQGLYAWGKTLQARHPTEIVEWLLRVILAV